MGDEEISEVASSGKFILMEKGEILEIKVDERGESLVEILKSEDLENKRAPLDFYVVSDTHSGYNIFMPILQEIVSKEPDFIILNGDIVNNGYSLEYVVASSIIESLPIPVFTTIGNHDIWNNGGKYYNSYFGQSYYYFDHKETRFIFLDSSTAIIGNTQFEWLKSVLENSEGKRIIVFSHISPIDTVTGDFDDGLRANKQMSHTIALKSESDYILGLMEKYNVTAFIAGHSHVKGRVKVGNTEYITTGVLGGSILPGEDVSYLKVSESNGEIIFEQIDINNEFIDENSIKAKTQSMRVFLIPFLISKSIRISLSIFLLIGFSLFMYFFKDRLFYTIK
jgi:3',5'-cyclic AMP phosphodiesterase CpdA